MTITKYIEGLVQQYEQNILMYETILTNIMHN